MTHPASTTSFSGIVVRQALSKQTNLLGGVIHSSDPTQTNSFISTSTPSCTSSTNYNFASGATTSGFLKIERTSSTSFVLSYSQDGVTYWLWKQATNLVAASTSVYWGIVKGDSSTSSTTTTDYTYLGVNGLGSGCASNQVCRYSSSGSTCVTDPSNSFVECSQDQWRTMVLSGSLSNPILTFDLSQPSVIHIMAQFPVIPGSQDAFFYAYKILNGDGEITARVDSRASNTAIAGLMFQRIITSETQIQQNDMAACIFPRQNFGYSAYRSSASYTGANSAIQIQNDVPFFIRLKKTGDTYTCSYNPSTGTTTPTTWTDLSTFTVSLGSPLYGGLVTNDQNSPALSVTFSNIFYTSFTGYCNNRALQCGTVNSILDNCICPNSYVGTLCESVACFGIIASSSTACSGQGTCNGPNNCTCNAFSTGSNCQYTLCYGIGSNDPSVCSGKGSCISLNSCACQNGYGSSNCSVPICFGTPATNSTVCSGEGSCIAPNNCSCQTGYSGSLCQNYQCFGINSTNPSVCNGQGTCISPNNCNCNSTYFGPSCSLTTCYGIQSNNTNACSGNGNCTSFNICSCSAGYISSNCSIPVCFGINGNNSNVCSGRGSCTSPNNCSCQTGYGAPDCSATICNGILSTNSSVCSSRGTCVSPNNCSCNTGYGSSDCSGSYCYGILSTNPSVCSGRGSCVSPNNCVCNTGYGYINCSASICNGTLSNNPSVCSKKGVCVAPNTCNCLPGYTGSTCQIKICYGVLSNSTSICSGNGTCVAPNTCSCNSGYFGSACNITSCYGIYSNSSSVCSGQGTCYSPNNCICTSSYTGPNCQFPICSGLSSNNTNVCSGNGTCIAPNTCSCYYGYTGSNCQSITCANVGYCTGNGTCIGPNICNCYSGWTGSNCSVPICYGINATMTTVCSGNGKCTNPNTCVCNGAGITGAQCSQSACVAENSCSGNGLCIAPNNCTCFDGWIGTNCSTFICSRTNNCSYPNGNCVGPQTCSCTSQWSGTNCSLPVCFSKSSSDPTVCSGEGTCVAPGTCSCNSGYSGNNCQFISCYGKNSSNPSSVCSGSGTCVSPDNCQCNTNYIGAQCQYPVCFGTPSNSSSVCSGNGNCVAANTCNCNSTYGGNNCQYPKCNGITSNDPTVCSGVGSCNAPETCVCNSGYTGLYCQFPICYGVNSSLSTVCSSQGNCTLPDTCVCNPTFYGSNCSNSFLWDFVNDICGSGCSLNLNTWQTCILNQGASCFCNPSSAIQTTNTQVQCQNGMITSIRINNSGLNGFITNIQMLTSLASLDLSNNNILVTQTFDNVLPSQIQTIKLSNDSLSNQGTLYQVNTTFFTNLTSYVLDQNSICGVYPSTWINNTFGLSLINHAKTLWCSTLNPNVCTLVSLPTFYVIYPSETQVFLNNTNVISACQFYLQSSNLLCNSINGTYSQISTSSYNTNTNSVVCSRSNLVSSVNQQLNLRWNFGSFLETISTTVSVTNLPYAQIIDIDKRVIYSPGTGTDTITMDLNQNMTTYRKNPSNPVRCSIQPDGYTTPAISVDSTGTRLSCSINLLSPSQSPRYVTIVDDTNTFTLSSNNIQFYLVDTKIAQNSLLQNSAQNVVIQMSNNQNIPAYPGLNYYLFNNAQNITANCLVSSGTIQTCAMPTVSISNDIGLLQFQFMEGNRTITNVSLLFYKNITISILYPKGIIADGSSNVIFGQMLSSTFNVQPGLIGSFSMIRTGNTIPMNPFNSTFFNFTDSSTSSLSTSYTISYTLPGYATATISNGGNQVNFISQISIYRESNTVLTNGISYFNFSTIANIPLGVSDSLACRFDGQNQNYPILYVSSTYFYCGNLVSYSPQNISFWFIDSSLGRNFKISSSPISLIFLPSSNISFALGSSQIGYENTFYSPMVQFNSLNISSSFNSRILCYQNGIPLTTTSPSSNIYTCNNLTGTQGIASLQIMAQIPNAFKVQNVLSYFNNEITYSIQNTDTSNDLTSGTYIRFTLDTTGLISQGLMKADCSDLTVAYSNVEIGSSVSSCNTVRTYVFINVYATIPKSGGIDNNYAILYGNPVKSSAPPVIITTEFVNIIETSTFVPESIITLSPNTLSFAIMRVLTIQSSDPTSINTNTLFNLALTTTFNPPNYQNLIQYQIGFSSYSFPSTFSNGVFTSLVSVPTQQNASINIFAVYGSQSLLLSSSPFSFIFTSKMTLNYLLPFAGKYTTNSITQSIQVYSQTGFLISNGLYCKQTLNGVTVFQPATTTLGSNILTCTISTSSLSATTEFIDVGIWANVSSNSTLDFDLSSSPLTFVVFKEPLSTSFPSYIRPSNFGTFYNLGFSNPLYSGKTLSYQNYNVTITPSILPNPTYTLNCTFNLNSQCSISNITFSYVPIQIQFSLIMISSFSTQTFSVSMGSIWFIESTSFLIEYPFVLDQSITQRTITFTVSKSLYQGFLYYCTIFNTNVTATRAGSDNSFTCTFTPRNLEEQANFTLVLNNTAFNYPLISDTSNVYLTSLTFQQPYTISSGSDTFYIQRIPSNIYQIPSKYIGYTYTATSGTTFTCNITNGQFFCTKSTTITSNDMTGVNFNLNSNIPGSMTLMTPIARPLIVYKTGTIQSISPISGLRGNNYLVSVTHVSSMFNGFGSLPTTATLNCSSTGSTFRGIYVSNTIVKCSVSGTLDQLPLSTFFMLPQYSSNQISLATSNINSTFYNLDPGFINFTSINQTRFFLTGVLHQYNITVNTFIPSPVQPLGTCTISGETNSVGTYLSSIPSENFYSCLQTVVNPGLKTLTFSVVDSITYQLSNNSLQVMYATPCFISSFSPQAAIANVSTNFVFTTTFANVNYGSSTFQCMYQLQGVLVSNYSSPATFSNGAFSCSVLYPYKNVKIQLSIWMNAFGTSLKITSSPDTLINVVTANYFSPSYGTPAGGESVTIFIYNYPNTTNVTFSLTNSFIFTCSNGASSLNCITPTINNFTIIQLYASYQLVFTNAAAFNDPNLSARYIFYDKRSIVSYSPGVIPATLSSFNMMIIVNANTTINQGSFYAVVAPNTINDERTFMNQVNGTTFTTIINPISSGALVSMQIYYYHPDSFENRNMFSISPSVNVTFLQSVNILLAPNSNSNIMYINTPTTITFQLDAPISLSPNAYQFIQCKLGNTVVTTVYIGSSQFNCTVSSSTARNDTITLWYINTDAYQGGFRFSTNSYDIIFVSPINVQLITPYASLSTTTQNVNVLTSSVLNYPTVTYQCLYNGTLSTATLNGNTFNCDLTRNFQTSFSGIVSIYMVSQQSQNSILYTTINTGSPQFYFLNQISTLGITPHAIQNQTSNMNVSVTIYLSSPLITANNLYCELLSNEGLKYSIASYGSNINSITCNVSKTYFYSEFEVIYVGLYMAVSSSLQFNVTSDYEPFLFLRNPIQWQNPRFISSTSQFYMNGSLPTTSFIYQLNSTSFTVPCTFLNTPNCSLSQILFNSLDTVPYKLPMTFYITHPITQLTLSFSIDMVIINYVSDIQSLKPYVISYQQYLFIPARIIMNALKKLDPSMNYRCLVNQTSSGNTIYVNGTFDVTSLESTENFNPQSYISCSFTTFGTANLPYILTLQVQDPFSLSWNSISSQNATIYTIGNVLLSQLLGPSTGGTYIQVSNFNYLPTTVYQTYNVTMKIYDRGNYIDFSSCVYTPSESLIECYTPDITPYYISWTEQTKKLRFDIVIDNLRVVSLSPYFIFYKSINIQTILPSSFIFGQSPSSITFITSTPIEFNGGSITFSFDQAVVVPCSITSSTSILCPNVQLPLEKTYTVQYTFNGLDFINSGKILTNFLSIPITSFTPSTLSMYKNTTLSIQTASTFLNSPNTIVRISDNILQINVPGTFINSQTINAIIPPFYDKDAIFPRNLQVSISYDAGTTFVTFTSTITVNAFPTVSITNYIPLNTIVSGLVLSGFPSSGLDFDPSKTLVFRLADSNSDIIGLTCNSPYTSCNMNSAITITGTYNLQIGLSQLGVFTPIYVTTNSISTYWFSSSNVTSISPPIIVRSTNQPMIITGNFGSISSGSIYVLFSTSQGLLASISSVATQISTGLSVPIPNIPTATLLSISLSFNGGVYYHPLNMNVTFINSYSITASNPNNVRDPTVFFTFLNSNVTVVGSNFINTGSNVKITLSNSNFNIDITNLVQNLQFISSSLITFNAPLYSQLNINYTVQFPLTLNLGLSFNGGIDTKYATFIYTDQYPQPIYSNIFPSLTYRKPLNLTIYGLNLDLASTCSFYDIRNTTVGAEIYETTPQSTGQTNSVICLIPAFSFIVKKVAVYLKNLQYIRGPTYFNFTLYDVPVITSQSLISGIAYGKFPINIYGFNFTYSVDIPTIYCRFNSFLCDKPCVYVSQNEIICTAPSHPPGPSYLQISYNNIDWHISPQNTTFTPCDPGYSTPSFDIPCTLCPPGTYKPTSGIYSCILCSNDTYSQFAGSLSCDNCPDNTTTGIIIGARSYSQCICQVGYYMNTKQEEVIEAYRKCISCPQGGVCPTINTTIPLAQPGYWYDQSDWTTFAQCSPIISCPGGGFQNCTDGYSGLRCGVCSRGYYRFKKNCVECGNVGTSWLRLIGIGIAIAIVTALFFALSATKVSHIASIAIAFSFWQVLSMFAQFDIQWPGTISGTLTGASVANFNFDFLSPSCIFPDMNYVTLWYLQMILPVAFLVSFIILYFLLILRSLMASVIGKVIKISYINPNKYINDDDEDDEEDLGTQQKQKETFIGRILTSILKLILRITIFIRNFIVWTFTEKSSYRELKKILNRIINAYFAFLSFSFIFIMTTASQVFVCQYQTNGAYTLNDSPDIRCYQDSSWWSMLPITILWYIIFGGGSAVYFIVIWFKFDEWSKDTDFNERNKFMLARFRHKYYFWEAVVTLRKTILSILYIFFKPMLVIVSGVLLLFLGFLLHIYFVPFKRKFHNVMDYFVILVTMATLFFGLLFFVNKWPDVDPVTGFSQTKNVAEWIAFIVLIASTVIVVSMILWDSSTRRKKERKHLRKKLRKLILEQEEDRKTKQILLDLHDQKEENTSIYSSELPWDTEFDYKPIVFKTDSESTSEEDLTINEIFFDLFSKKRLYKKLHIIRKKGTKVKGTIMKVIKGKKEEDKDSVKPLIREDTGIKMDKKTQAEYDYVLKKMEEEKRKTLNLIAEKDKKKSMKGVKDLKAKNEITELQNEIIEEDIKQKENPNKISALKKLKKTDNREVREEPKPFEELKPIEEEIKEEKKEEIKEEIKEIKEEKKEKPKPTEKKYPIITNRKELYPGPLEEFIYKEEPEDSVIWEDENKKSIKETTLDKLIELLTSPTYFDSLMQHTFMLTFRSFTDGETLFKKLIERFNIQPSTELSDEEFAKWKVEVLDKIRLRVSSAIKYWIENFYIFDFNDEKMKGYVDDTIKMMDKCKGGKVFSQVIVRALSKAMDEDQKLIITQGECPPIEKPEQQKRKSLFSGGTVTKTVTHPILIWPSIEIARQLTLIEFSNFSKIEPKECLNQSWAKGQRETKAPGICAMVSRFNQLSMWVGSTIVQAKEIEERVLIIEKFLDIAEKLYDLNNFNGVFTIVSGLALSPIYRLKKSWSLISDEAKKKHENLAKLISREGNFKAIRDRIKNVKPPAMPYIGIYLTDLTFIEDGNPKYVNGKINFFKCKCFAGVIRDMQTYQNTKYFFTKASDLYEPLLNVTAMTEKEMYDMSLEVEPKEKKQPK